MADNSAVHQFITDSLKVAGATYNVIHNELIMAQCQVQIPKSFFRPARVENISLQMVTRPELLDKYPGSELVTQGSFRLHWFVEGIRERGLVTRGSLSYDLNPGKVQREIAALLTARPDFYFARPSLQYQPHLLVNFHVSLETDEKFEELYNLSINLVNGEITTGLLADLGSKRVVASLPPAKMVIKRQIPYSEGFKALFNHLKWVLENHEAGWILGAKKRWEEEVRYLEQYFQGNETDGLCDEGNFYRQSAEVYRKFQPVIRIRAMNIGLLYLPIVTYTLEGYQTNQQLAPLVYDPLRRTVRQVKINPERANGPPS